MGFCKGLELYAAILPDRTAASAAKFLLHDVIDCCPYTIECAYSDNGVEYRGNAEHPFGVACVQNNIGQKFTRIARPQTNGKAQRVIRTIMAMWHEKQTFGSSEHRQQERCRFVNFDNTVKPHRSLKGDTSFEVLQAETFAKPPSAAYFCVALAALLRLELHPHLAVLQRSQAYFSQSVV